jgi:hypothetical protein
LGYTNQTLYLKSTGTGNLDYDAGDSGYHYFSDGGVVVGSPTGGNKGDGTINAVAVYDDNSLLTDYVFETAYEGKAFEEQWKDYKLISLDEAVDFTKQKYHLPFMTGRNEWEAKGKPSVGKTVSELTETVENMFLYIAQLNDKIKALEEQSK